jgi:hypothetical protein
MRVAHPAIFPLRAVSTELGTCHLPDNPGDVRLTNGRYGTYTYRPVLKA